jgi:hypothetical protein
MRKQQLWGEVQQWFSQLPEQDVRSFAPVAAIGLPGAIAAIGAGS